jgi:hypothetical protein
MSIVLVGGVIEPRKLAWARAALAREIDWWPSRRSRGPMRALVGRIRAGRIDALVVLEDLVGHHHHDAVVRAARETGVPVAYARTAGQGALRQAFADVEARRSRTNVEAVPPSM